MKKNKLRIASPCPLYACRECRTKTGWPHQRWCSLAKLTEPACADCCYRNPAKDECVHPRRRKGGDAD